MNIIEYGKDHKEVVILLHGGGLSWWNYKEIAEILQKKYHVIIPILDGHSGSNKHFTSIYNNAMEIIDYIDKYFGGSVLFIGGLSLGGQILLEIMTQRNDICKIALIESALVIPMKITHCLVKPMIDWSYGLIKMSWFSKLQFKSLKIKQELYEDYYRDTCNITKENMISILKENTGYKLNNRICDTQAKVFIFVGQKEQKIMIRSAKKIQKMIKHSELTIMNHLYHGEFSINHAKSYSSKVCSIIECF